MNGWEIKPLGELCNVVGGGTPSKNKPHFYSGDIPWATVRDMKSDLITHTEYKITKEAVAASATNIIPFGNVVIATRVGLGKVCLVKQATAINQDLRGIIPKNPKTLSVQYLFWWLKSIASQIEKEGTGATVQGVKLPFVKGLLLPYPSFTEQRRIAAILDEAFEAIATAKANAEKNLQSVREVFDSHLSSVFSAKHALVALSELASDITDGDHMPPPKALVGVPFITISNIVKRTRAINFNGTFLVSPEYFARLKPNRKPRRGDVLYTVTGATLGIPVLVDHDADFCFQRHIALIRPRPGTNSTWLSYLMSSPQVFSQATAGATGAAQKTVSLTLLRSIKVPKHLEAEQVRIASELDELSARTYRLEDLCNERVTALNELKKSLLHQAFIGALTTKSTDKELEAVV